MDDTRFDLHDKVINTCVAHSVSQEHPVFYERLVFYLKVLRECVEEFVQRNAEHIDFALEESHAMIVMDEDLDCLGCEHLVEIWEKALDIKYGRDYGYILSSSGYAYLNGLARS